MGLDIVELLLNVEETFDLHIPNEDAQRLDTPRKLIDYLEARLLPQESGPCLSQRAFYRLRRGIEQVQNIPARSVTPSTTLESLFPVPERRQAWKALQEKLELPLPKLHRSTKVVVEGWVLAIAAGVLVYFLAERWAFWAFAATLSLYLTATEEQKVYFEMKTLGQLAQRLVARSSRELLESSERWSRSQIRAVVVSLVKETTGVKDLDLDDHFVRDLGMD
jgi:acyl carrier protein